MIQLDNRKKIIVGAIIFLIIILISVLVIVKNKNSNKIVSQPTSIQTTEVRQPRLMTQEEKVNVVGIDPSQDAEVLNDQNGLYIYRIKK
jgi:LPS O-antigen subunit length determinant protein (WzzB/FepE family)